MFILTTALIIAAYIIICIFALITAFFEYEIPSKRDVRITYKQFRMLDAMSPEKWTRSGYGNNVLRYKDNDGHEHAVYMKTLLDAIRLSLYMKCLSNEQKNKARDKELLILVKEWQKDINDFNNRNEKWMEERIESILNKRGG